MLTQCVGSGWEWMMALASVAAAKLNDLMIVIIAHNIHICALQDDAMKTDWVRVPPHSSAGLIQGARGRGWTEHTPLKMYLNEMNQV